ncbi:MAG: penicillin-binding protein 2, partial [Agrococcus casei]
MARRGTWNIRRSTRLRTTLVGVLIVALVSVFIVRLADIQVVNAAQLNEQSDERRTSTQVLHGARGDIVDANGTVMATSVDRWAV